ncbi:hypothetical protein G7K_2405-t1 [Saitoella complicata NRRL Y-17804]|uniref:Uncharacterized protein n=1 Tax=Saitoella complicata (strain BCRC 22490 / CBS 7301 / JCM 7358 / NBRC 10748 / NRRL Y-17804) TaxID=698492 RepID=A0A0E9NFN7_SAICN|nr:hypothetical protein G7K_2405-t1 [Saitoella complicata NRRL Y-17804]
MNRLLPSDGRALQPMSTNPYLGYLQHPTTMAPTSIKNERNISLLGFLTTYSLPLIRNDLLSSTQFAFRSLRPAPGCTHLRRQHDPRTFGRIDLSKDAYGPSVLYDSWMSKRRTSY